MKAKRFIGGDVSLRDKFVEEIGDLYAALDFFIENNDIDKLAVADQFVKKLYTYRKWNKNPEKYAAYKPRELEHSQFNSHVAEAENSIRY